ncbi:SDR family oxidoreductase [Bradyrhizobium sp. dw_78]|uniref:SDR family NAD(P)-dependent oxidoreductase n=1 Tax=Bradyrhizobium sp. dw_78 TaxID=2719793 RepID=UPI001BD47A0D|nr:SDR family oxidoreductase [Bradyrhizobium sp. dw_78]
MSEAPVLSAPSWTDYVPSGRLKGRRILITGAGSGIARRTAELFAEEGAALALLDRDAAAVQATGDKTGGHAVVADVTEEASVNAAVATAAEAMGGIDGVVNAAGISAPGKLDEVDVATWQRVIAVNLVGPYLVVRAALPWLRKADYATIANVASGQGLLPNGPSASAYHASKGGLINLTRSMASELAPKIRVNSVCPGMVETAMTRGRTGTGGQYALKRIGTTLEVAQALLFVSSKESAFITGVAIPVDGGRTFH